MSYTSEYAHSVVQSMGLEAVRNFVAQSKAKQVLREVHEMPDNFPSFTDDLDVRVTFIAYSQLAAGCTLIELGEPIDGYTELQSAADILESAHRTETENNQVTGFHCLIGAMAFYACGQYSRAFILMKDIETMTPAAGIITAFLRKDSQKLITRLNDVLLAETAELNDSEHSNEWTMTIIIARAISLVLEHSLSGQTELLEEAKMALQDTMIISESSTNPAFWWLARLLKLMLKAYGKASLWNVLPPFFGGDGVEHVEDYIRLLALSKPAVSELWESQLASLQVALNSQNTGGVINLRTSAGKTRVAELAILQTLRADSTAKVLYLAPFRSLAFELERTFSKTLLQLGFSISHLYGGARFSNVDREIVIEASITIATPEKAKAMLRAAPELFDSVKLIVVDEGHLLGKSERDVRNELFLEHLRLLSQQRGARILLLSAVLPNAEDLATWVGGDPQALAKSDWKPSSERFGILRWFRAGVRIDWKGEEACFNPHFVEFRQVTDEGRVNSRRFPKTKPEAVAATAVRLAEIGPVLIFAGQAQWVPSMTRSVLLALGDNLPEHEWSQIEWNIFVAVCIEELGEGSLVLKAARAGVICHSNKLPPQVRISIEKLMAKCSPKVIVATTTLGQGVNIGISSVIISTTSIGANLRISKRDFWNICGRAGRAFVDGEGKILFAIDNTKSAWHNGRDEEIAESYLDISNLDKVESGLLIVIRILQNIATMSGVEPELLLELIANNNFEPFGENKNNVQTILDLIDDQLLALHVANEGYDEAISIDWVDNAFRQSLALIQELNHIDEGQEPVIGLFLKARMNGVLLKVPTSQARRAVVASGLPLSVGLVAFEQLDVFREMVDRYLENDGNGDALGILVQGFENWARENAEAIIDNMPDQEILDVLRPQWLAGNSLHTIIEANGEAAGKICTELYGYQLPWLFHSIAQKFDKLIEENRVETLSNIGLLVELGLPTEAAAKVFLAGVRSRTAAVELGVYVVDPSASVSRILNAFLNPDTIAALSVTVTASTLGWLNMLTFEHGAVNREPVRCASFQLDVPIEFNELHVRQAEGQNSIFLCSTNAKYKTVVEVTEEMPFDQLVNDPRYVFKRNGTVWHQQSRDPRIHIE